MQTDRDREKSRETVRQRQRETDSERQKERQEDVDSLETDRQTDNKNVLKFGFCIGTCNIAFNQAKNKRGNSNATFETIQTVCDFETNVKISCVANFDFLKENYENTQFMNKTCDLHNELNLYDHR